MYEHEWGNSEERNWSRCVDKGQIIQSVNSIMSELIDWPSDKMWFFDVEKMSFPMFIFKCCQYIAYETYYLIIKGFNAAAIK